MSITIKMKAPEAQRLSPRIFVVGVGGAGGNGVDNMIGSGLEGCDFLVCNTDAQALHRNLCDNKVQLGVHVTGGLGAGSKPEIGRAAAEESIEEVMAYLEGANMVFITAGMGGGTGTGAAPVIARACRERGILTVGVVTKPFHFEGSHRMKSADKGIAEIQDYVDTLIVIPNQNLFRVANENTTFAQAFQMADSVLQAGVRGVTDLMVRPGLVNLDFADIRTAMQEMGKAMMGTGEASGSKRAIEAAEAAINNPLLDDVSMKGARGVIINVTGGNDMTLFEADEACNRIRDEVDPDANIIFGATFDQTLDGHMRVSIVATGIDKESELARRQGGASAKTEAVSNVHLERAVPNTAEASVPSFVSKVGSFQQPGFHQPSFVPLSSAPVSAANPVSAPAGYAPVLPQRPSAPKPLTPAQKIAEANKPHVQEPEAELFEQHEFAVEAPLERSADNSAKPRGSVYNNAFIPPRPAEAPSGAGLHISSFHGEHVPDDQASMSSALKLNPPRPAPAPQAKRSPSLFERISGTVQEHIGGLTQWSAAETKPRERTAPLAGSEGLSPAREYYGAPSQGALAIDVPAAKPAPISDENLDIPAFLRRQAN